MADTPPRGLAIVAGVASVMTLLFSAAAFAGAALMPARCCSRAKLREDLPHDLP